MIEFESFAVELAREAARVTLPFFRSGIGHEDKGGAAGFDPVTEADRRPRPRSAA
jgi:fructose-1,6-bisphosphatase/inositol monophosphatase family enzyme